MTEQLETERRAWLALASAPGVGEHTFQRLVEASGSAAGVLEAARDGSLRRRPPTDAAGRRVRVEVLDGIEAVAARPGSAHAVLESYGVWTITPLDPGYPDRFDVLRAPPPHGHSTGRSLA